MHYVLALDQGTSSSRAIVFDERGTIRSIAQREFRQIFPQPGWVEHDPFEIRDTQFTTAREAVAAAAIDPAAVAAVGIANQRETTLVWERASGRPIHNAIVWQDRRTEPICESIRARGLAPRVAEHTGLVVDAYFSASKIAWLLAHVPGAREKARRGELAFGTVDSWLVWQLTRGTVHVTDVTNASRTMLYDIRRGSWDDQLLDAFEIPRSMLPAVQPSSHVHATSDADAIGGAWPIAGIAGDQQAALFGQACFSAGMAKNTYGTGCFLLMHTGERFEPSRNGLVATAAAQTDAVRRYAFEGSVFVGGAVVQWLRDGLRAIERSSDVEALAASVPDSGGVMFVPAFTGLGAPWWKPDARGTITGLSRGTTVAHVARAALDAIAFQSAALLDAMGRDAGAPITELRVDGGAAANDLLMQFQADLLGIPVVRPAVTETTALGAAYLAGLATGVWRDTGELARHWRVERTFSPTMSRDRAASLMNDWEHAVRQATAA
ncbi:MAG: glycerol kinase GlpK [Burkholderiaceae bacterium]|nr:glycerol kinase GlpK [Burkholderiaceae bacterium]